MTTPGVYREAPGRFQIVPRLNFVFFREAWLYFVDRMASIPKRAIHELHEIPRSNTNNKEILVVRLDPANGSLCKASQLANFAATVHAC
jgi:hypothetical protein